MNVFVTLTLLAAAPEKPGFELVWLAPTNCQTRPDTASLVGEAQGHAEVQLREEKGAWLVTVIFLKPAEGVRRVSAPGCEEAVRAASLLVKLGSEGALPAQETVVEAPPSAPPVFSAPEPAPAPIEKPAVVPWNFSLAAGAALDVGALPSPAPRIAVSANLTHQLLRVALDLRFGLPSKLDADITTQRTFEAQGAGCLNFTWRVLSGGPCLAASVGSWSATASWGSGATVVATSASAQLRGALLIVAGLELGAMAGVRLTIGRPRVLLEGKPVFSTRAIAGDFQLTLGWRW